MSALTKKIRENQERERENKREKQQQKKEKKKRKSKKIQRFSIQNSFYYRVRDFKPNSIRKKKGLMPNL